MFQKKTWAKPFSEAVAKRVKKIPTAQLSPWAETCMNEVNRCLIEFSNSNSELYIREALKGAEALHAVVNELHDRSVVR